MNPLLDLHRASPTAEFIHWDNIEIVSTFGDPEAEYSAIHKSCALMDLPQRGLLEVTGRDRHAFLNNILSNQTFDKVSNKSLQPGESIYAFLLNAKTGRILADLNIIELGERTLLEIDARFVESVRVELEKYHFAEQVTIKSMVDSLHEIALHGPGAEDVLKQLAPGNDTIVWRNDLTGAPGCFLIAPADSIQSTWTTLLDRTESSRLGRRSLRPIGWAAFNSARIEAGLPIFGIDFDQSILPHETGTLLDRAVSFTKGCYPGQEIVARMQARGQMARKLVGIRMESDALPIAGEKIYDQQSNEVGGITSSTVSPLLSNTAICLGIVKKPFFELGVELRIAAEGQLRKGTVVATPFLKPGDS